jgi:hypothetical protein
MLEDFLKYSNVWTKCFVNNWHWLCLWMKSFLGKNGVVYAWEFIEISKRKKKKCVKNWVRLCLRKKLLGGKWVGLCLRIYWNFQNNYLAKLMLVNDRFFGLKNWLFYACDWNIQIVLWTSFSHIPNLSLIEGLCGRSSQVVVVYKGGGWGRGRSQGGWLVKVVCLSSREDLAGCQFCFWNSNTNRERRLEFLALHFVCVGWCMVWL